MPVDLVVIAYWATNAVEGYYLTFRDANDESVPSAPANKRIQELLQTDAIFDGANCQIQFQIISIYELTSIIKQQSGIIEKQRKQNWSQIAALRDTREIRKFGRNAATKLNTNGSATQVRTQPLEKVLRCAQP